jgi:hypothetical protein
MYKSLTAALLAAYVVILTAPLAAAQSCTQGDLKGGWIFHLTHTRVAGTTAQQNDLVCPVVIDRQGHFAEASCYQIEQSAFRGALLITGFLKITSTCAIRLRAGGGPSPELDVRIFTGPNPGDWYGFLFSAAIGWMTAGNQSFSLVMATGAGDQYAGRIIAFRRP